MNIQPAVQSSIVRFDRRTLGACSGRDGGVRNPSRVLIGQFGSHTIVYCHGHDYVMTEDGKTELHNIQEYLLLNNFYFRSPARHIFHL